MKSISDLLKELSDLPKGYISKKIIHGDEYFYLKYYENNKQISKYIKKDELSDLKEKLERRKEIEALIKQYDKKVRNITPLSKNARSFTGSIMSKDIKVATYENGNLIYINEDLCPLFIKRTHNISAFFASRAIDASRTHSRLLKKVMNIKESKDEYISLYANGLVISDTYWFKAKGSKLKYKDVCFDNDYYSDLALNGELVVYHKSPKLSPQLTAIGSFEKCWKKIKNEWWMYKKGTDEQIFSEIFCSLLANRLNIPTAIYEYVDGNIRTKNFADKFNFEPMSALVGDDERYESIFNTLYEIDHNLAKQYLLLMYFDCLINNIDRHNENLGVLRNIKTGQIVCLAPNFDNNLALIGWDKKLRINVKADGMIGLFVKFLKNDKTASKIYKKMKFVKPTDKMINECLNEIEIKFPEYDINKYVLSRYEYLIKIQNDL